MHVVVVDVETTGLSRYSERMTEFCAIKCAIEDNDVKVVDQFSSLINPQRPIPRFITKLTGITNEMVKDAPLPAHVAPKIKEFIGDAPIVAHNATFDSGFIHELFKATNHPPLTNPLICTRKLSRRVFPDLDSYSLKNLCSHFEIEHTNVHRAGGDTAATVILLKKILDEMRKETKATNDKVLQMSRDVLLVS